MAGNSWDSVFISAYEKGGISRGGAFVSKLTTKTGAPSVAGEIVEASDATADAVELTVSDSTHPIGAFLESGIADGREAWIAWGGIVPVKFDADGCSKGDWIKTSVTAGRAESSGSSTPGALHYNELGHALGDAAANAVANIYMHLL